MSENDFGGNNTTATEDSTASERIGKLERELADTNRTLNELFDYVETLERRVESLEADDEPNENILDNGDGNRYGYGDDRDAAVLDTMELEETYPIKAIRARYVGETDIQNEQTLRNRVEALCESSLFEPAGHGQRRFVGRNSEDNVSGDARE